jgi:hypothetical protein
LGQGLPRLVEVVVGIEDAALQLSPVHDLSLGT